MRVSEQYVSIQGEGPNVGLPTTFLRFGGCNLKCPSWPCDTQHAIDPKYRKEWKNVGVEETVAGLLTGPRNICLTGGEPFLQPKHEIEELAATLRSKGHTIEAFTNGTIAYTMSQIYGIDLVMDWKLPGSGEDHLNQVRLDNLVTMASVSELYGIHSVKFTIADINDFHTAVDIWKIFVRKTPLTVFAGVVWDKLDNAELVKWILEAELPWRLNVQLHNHIWDRSLRGI